MFMIENDQSEEEGLLDRVLLCLIHGQHREALAAYNLWCRTVKMLRSERVDIIWAEWCPSVVEQRDLVEFLDSVLLGVQLQRLSEGQVEKNYCSRLAPALQSSFGFQPQATITCPNCWADAADEPSVYYHLDLTLPTQDATADAQDLNLVDVLVQQYAFPFEAELNSEQCGIFSNFAIRVRILLRCANSTRCAK
ncbi:hypothetical protein LTR22_028477 [Elasticomyces elasticus]|nr:hypothetical protein LTR22_028477 [Elasticomyces elasticus]